MSFTTKMYEEFDNLLPKIKMPKNSNPLRVTSVKPMSAPTGQIFYFDSIYKDDDYKKMKEKMEQNKKFEKFYDEFEN